MTENSKHPWGQPVDPDNVTDDQINAALAEKKAAAEQKSNPTDQPWGRELTIEDDKRDSLSVKQILDLRASQGRWDEIDSRRNRVILLLDRLLSTNLINKYVDAVENGQNLKSILQEMIMNKNDFDDDTALAVEPGTAFLALKSALLRARNSDYKSGDQTIDTALDALFAEVSFNARMDTEFNPDILNLATALGI